jgi:phage-related protein
VTTTIGYSTVELTPSAAGLGAAMHFDIALTAASAGNAGGDAVGRGALAIAARFAAPLAIAVGFGAIVKRGLGEAVRAASGTAQLQAGIASTGGVAGVTADGLSKLAREVQLYSGQTDDSIVASEKLLLTFTGIRNVGPDKIFDRATKATADMAARMGGDASASAVQLGKALNDPIAGISSLSRVGVQFTDSQKDMIKSLVEGGDVIGAQNIILGELETQFGGSAAAAGQTFPGQVQILKRSFEDFSQAIIGRVLPSLIPFIAFLSSGLQSATAGVPAVLDFIAGKFGVVRDAIGTVANAFQGQPPTVAMGAWTGPLTTFGAALATMVGGVVTGFQFIRDAISLVAGTISGAGANLDLGPLQGPLIDFGIFLTNVFAQVGPVFQTIGGAVVTAFAPLLPVLANLIPQFVSLAQGTQPLIAAFADLRDTLLGIFADGLAQNLAALAAVHQALLPVALELVQSLGGLLLETLVKLAPIIGQLLAGQLSTFAANLTVLAPVIGTLAVAVVSSLLPPLSALLEHISLGGPLMAQLFTAISPLITAILALLPPILGLISPLLQLVGAILTPLIQLFSVLLQPILALITPLVGLLTPAISGIAWVLGILVTALSTAIQWIVDLVTGSGDAGTQLTDIWNTTMGMFGDFFANTFGMFSDFITNTFGMFSDFGANLWSAASTIWTNVTGAFSTGIGTVVGFFTNLPGQVLGALGNVGGILVDVGKNIFQGLMDGITAFTQTLADAFLAPLADAVSAVTAALGIHSPSRVFRAAGENASLASASAYAAPPASMNGVARDKFEAATAAARRYLDDVETVADLFERVDLSADDLDGKVIAQAIRRYDRSVF